MTNFIILTYIFLDTMQITLAGEYALRAMIFLSSQGVGVKCTIIDISKAKRIPEMFLRKIIPLLCKSGLIISKKGKSGGIFLARDPNKITPLDILEAVDGPIYLTKCINDKNFCQEVEWCSVHSIWNEILVEMRNKLSQKSIVQIAVESEKRKLLHINKLNS